MKKILIIVSIIFTIGAAFYAGRLYQFMSADKTDSVSFTEDNETIQATNSYVAILGTTSAQVIEVIEDNPAEAVSEVKLLLNNLEAGDTIQSPLVITGSIIGPWFFEAQATVEVQDNYGNILGFGITTAEDLWLDKSIAGEAVDFSSRIMFAQDLASEGKLVFKNANMSGLKQHDRSIQLPIKIATKNQLASLQLNNLEENTLIKSPLAISGNAVGWFYEGEFTVVLTDIFDTELGRTQLVAQDDWMSYEYVPFEGNLVFNETTASIGTLTFIKANPANENNEQYAFLVRLKD